MSRKRLPKGFRKGTQDEIACPHRDLSCCPTCAAAHVELVDVAGRHYWYADPAEREEIKRLITET